MHSILHDLHNDILSPIYCRTKLYEEYIKFLQIYINDKLNPSTKYT